MMRVVRGAEIVVGLSTMPNTQTSSLGNNWTFNYLVPYRVYCILFLYHRIFYCYHYYHVPLLLLYPQSLQPPSTITFLLTLHLCTNRDSSICTTTPFPPSIVGPSLNSRVEQTSLQTGTHLLLWPQIPLLEVQQCMHPHPCSTDKAGRPTCFMAI